MKIFIKNVTICTRGYLRKQLENAILNGFDKSRPKLYGYVLGVYDAHWFGICIYRNHENFK